METVNVRPHVPEEELHAFSDGQLSSQQHVEIAEHLMGCLLCRAQHAEVEALRGRATALLALAVPAAGRNARRTRRVRTLRHRWPRIATAAAAAMVGLGVWFSLKPEVTGSAATQLAATLGLPRQFVPVSGVDSAGMRAKQLEISGRTTAAPHVLPSGTATRAMSAGAIGTTQVDPVFTTDWTVTRTDSARALGGGSLAHVDSVAVSSVRIHPSALGGRPTIMVRQQLRDGRPFWVFEGLEDDITPFSQVLQASGISTSMVTRTRPDYVGTGSDIRISTRMVTVAGYLPVDSLNKLVAKVTLR
jgi:hypothetical protein